MKKFALGTAMGLVVSLVILLPASHIVIDGFVDKFVRPYLLLEMGIFGLLVSTGFVLQTIYDHRAGYMWGSRSWEGPCKQVFRAEAPAKFRFLLGVRVVGLSLAFAFFALMVVLQFQAK